MELSFLQRNVLFHGREKIDEERLTIRSQV